MQLTLVTLRSIFFACGFLSFWTWIAFRLRRFDSLLGGALPAWSGALGPGALVLGGMLAAWCVEAFIVRGHGTPAPFDAPRRLVVVGPYLYLRNPMYVGGALLLLGLGLELRSPAIVLFVPAWWLLFHLFVVFYEETALRAKFGLDYDRYCQRTPRWIPRFRRPVGMGSPAGSRRSRRPSGSDGCHRVIPMGYGGNSVGIRRFFSFRHGLLALLLVSTTLLNSAEQKPNFTGKWELNPEKSDFGALPGPDRRTDQIEHAEPVLRLTSRQTRGGRESIGQWECLTDGSPCTVSIQGAELRVASRVTWAGTALTFDSQGEYRGGPVRISDRWTLSPDGNIITIARRMTGEAGETHQTLTLEKQ